MNILLANDDGIFAPGLAAIYNELAKLGEVTVAAPAEPQSGTGHSITFYEPLAYNKVNINGSFSGYSVHGSPADCVKLAAMKLCPEKPDLVVSGINNGANTGINVFYSGTVAAAIEGAFLKIPSVAFSMAREDEMLFTKAAKLCRKTLEKLLPLDNPDVININIPRLSQGKPKGTRVVPQSRRGFNEYYTEVENELGQTVYQLTAAPYRTEPVTADTTELMKGYITVTALMPDMTNHKRTQEIKKFFRT